MARDKHTSMQYRNNPRYKTKTRRLLAIALLVFVITAVIMLLNAQVEYRKAQNEYNDLRLLEPSPSSSIVSSPAPSDEKPISSPQVVTEFAQKLLDINPDYIGWIKIEDTVIDYPIVQGADNGTYINRTFSGEYNASGSIFMDWKCEGRFSNSLAVLFGHKMKDGSMFASLHSYQDNTYLEKHPDISVTLPNGETLTYKIFAVRLTTVTDSLFSLFDKEQKDIEDYFSEYDAPEGATRFLVLSTCTTGGNDNNRLLIFAALTLEQ